MPRLLALVSPLLLLAACNATPFSDDVSLGSPTGRPIDQTTVAPSLAPAASPNRPAHAGAPAIEEPYWLLYNGPSTSSVTDKDGVVIQTDRGESFQVVDGGSLEGTILIDGVWIGSLDVTVTEGEAIAGLDPIEQQYGAQIDDIHPTDGVPARSPNPFWVRTTERRAGVDVFVRVPASPSDGDSSQAFWWDAAHEKWYELSVTTDGDFESVLAAVLGPVQA